MLCGRRGLLILAAGLILISAGCGKKRKQGEGPMRIAGASNLVFAMEELLPIFEKNSGVDVDFIAGSSGKLAAQIREGAPFDVFMAANVAFVDDVVSAGSCEGDSEFVYGRGRIAMWKPPGKGNLPGDLAALATAQIDTLAIAQPEHAPYGAAAVAALKKVGAWDAVAPKLVYGSNIKDTQTMAATGNADLAIVSLSLALQEKGKYREIPEDLHAPIEQAMAVCKGGQRVEVARQFAEFIKSPEVREALVRYGYSAP